MNKLKSIFEQPMLVLKRLFLGTISSKGYGRSYGWKDRHLLFKTQQ